MIILWLCGIIFLRFSVANLIIEIPDGKIQGTTIETTNGKVFYAWRGIPYAQPPLGELRFLSPRPPNSWTDVLDASKDSPACLFQVTYNGDPIPINGNSEDCLYINVYSPIDSSSQNNSSKLPVMVYIYGGGFVSGSSDFNFLDPTPFLEEDVIIVTFNYRLSAFGFLSTGDEIISGNTALKDQLLALKWTNNNIEYFGGDPDSITVFGESAGAMSAGYHMVSPKSKGLFKGVIMQSGNALTNFFTKDDVRTMAVGLANGINSSITESNSSEEIKYVLQNASADLILNVTITLGYSFKTVLEVESDEAFLTNPMYESIEQGNFTKVPIIIGHNSEETCAFATDLTTAQLIADSFQDNSQLLMPNMPLTDGADPVKIGQEIIEEYVGKNGSFKTDLAAFFNWWSDEVFVRSVYKHAILQSYFTPVYMYQFSYYGTKSKPHPNIPGAGKVGHADDVAYLFNISSFPIETDSDFLARRRLVKLWTNFAKTQNPTPDDETSEILENVKWEVTTPDNVRYLDIGDDLVMKPSRKVKETVFWDYIWSTYSYRPYNTL